MESSRPRLERVAVTPSDFPQEGRLEVAMLGRSNVGKSSLLNKLFGVRGLARVSKTPGRTREIHFYGFDARLYIVDLPGYGYAKISASARAAWGELISSYLSEREQLVLALQLIDSRHEPQPLDHEMRALLLERGVPTAVALTKGDKLSKAALQSSVARARRELHLGPATPIVATSAETGFGMKDLYQLIDERVSQALESRKAR